MISFKDWRSILEDTDDNQNSEVDLVTEPGQGGILQNIRKISMESLASNSRSGSPESVVDKTERISCIPNSSFYSTTENVPHAPIVSMALVEMNKNNSSNKNKPEKDIEAAKTDDKKSPNHVRRSGRSSKGINPRNSYAPPKRERKSRTSITNAFSIKGKNKLEKYQNKKRSLSSSPETMEKQPRKKVIKLNCRFTLAYLMRPHVKES